MIEIKEQFRNEAVINDYSLRKIAKEYLKTSPSFIIKALAMSATMLLRPKIVGLLGEEYLAVNSELQNYELLIYKLCFGTQVPILQLTSKANQETGQEQVGLIQRSGLIQSMLLCPVAIGVCFTVPVFMELTKQPDIVLNESKRYFSFVWIAFCIDLIVNLQNQTMLGLGHIMVPNVTDCLGTLVYLLSLYGFVLGKMGLPKLDVMGLAVSLIITKSLLLVIKSGYVFKSNLATEYELYNFSKGLACPYLKKLFVKGTQIGVQGILDIVSPTVITTLLGRQGTRGLIAMQAATPFSMMIAVPNFYLSCQVNVLMSEAVGQQDPGKVRGLLKVALLVSLVYAVFASSALIFFAKELTGLILDHDDVNYPEHLQLSSYFLKISVALEVLNGFGSILSHSLWAHLDTRYALGSSFFLTTLLTSSLSIVNRHSREEYLFATPLLGTVLALSVLALRVYWVTYKKPSLDNLEKNNHDIFTSKKNTKRCCYLFNRWREDTSPLIKEDEVCHTEIRREVGLIP